jgi:hypothetical protein
VFATIDFHGYRIYGLTRKEQQQVPKWIDVRDQMAALRRFGIPREFIPISHDGTEFYFSLLAESSAAGQAHSVIVLGPDRENVQVAQSFSDCLRRAAASGGVYELVGD